MPILSQLPLPFLPAFPLDICPHMCAHIEYKQRDGKFNRRRQTSEINQMGETKVFVHKKNFFCLPYFFLCFLHTHFVFMKFHFGMLQWKYLLQRASVWCLERNMVIKAKIRILFIHTSITIRNTFLTAIDQQQQKRRWQQPKRMRNLLFSSISKQSTRDCTCFNELQENKKCHSIYIILSHVCAVWRVRMCVCMCVDADLFIIHWASAFDVLKTENSIFVFSHHIHTTN